MMSVIFAIFSFEASSIAFRIRRKVDSLGSTVPASILAISDWLTPALFASSFWVSPAFFLRILISLGVGRIAKASPRLPFFFLLLRERFFSALYPFYLLDVT